MWRILHVLLITNVHGCFGSVSNWDVFSTKTAYKWAHSVQDPSINSGYQRAVDGRLCNAMHVNMVVRHGARYPSDLTSAAIENMRQRLLNDVDGPMYQKAKAWTNPYTKDLTYDLATEGEEEQIGLGKRTGIRFSDLFNSTNENYIKFVSSSKARAEDSARHFYTGINSMMSRTDIFKNEINNTLLRFYDGCTNYEIQVQDNTTHFQELHKYQETRDFVDIQDALRTRLGFRSSISTGDVYLIYKLCAYNKYIQRVDTFWCDLLTDQERLVLEYAQDIKNYYEVSYGHPINSEMTCLLVSAMFHELDVAVNDRRNYEHNAQGDVIKGYLAGTFRFGHVPTIVPLMTAFGLYKDSEPLLASKRLAMANRYFRISDIAPYSSNVALVLYQCVDDQNGLNNRSFMVQLYVNEKIVRIPSCDGEMCPYEQVRRSYSELIDKCNIEHICSSKNNGAVGGNFSNTITMSLIFLTVIALYFVIHN